MEVARRAKKDTLGRRKQHHHLSVTTLFDSSSSSSPPPPTRSKPLPPEEIWVRRQEKEIKSLPPLSKYCNSDNHQKVLELVMVQTLRTMGLSENKIQEMLATARENASVPPRYILDTNVQQSLTSLALNVLTPYLKEQIYLSKVLKAQACARGWLVRRTKKKYETIYKPLGLHKRLPLFQEILRFQRKFVCDLQLFTGVFHDTLHNKDSHKSIITEEESFALFSNFPRLLKLNQSLYTTLLRATEKEWPFIDGFASIFWAFRDKLVEYCHAATSFQYQRDTFERLLTTKPKFSAALQNCIPGGKVYVPKIFDRVANYLKDFLRLVENYEAEVPVSGKLLSELCALRELRVFVRLLQGRVEQRLSLSTEKARIRDVLRRVVPEGFYLEDVLLNDDERRYLREGEVIVLDQNGKKVTKRYLFLFSDLLLVTKAGGTGVFKITSQNVLPLEKMMVTSGGEGEGEQKTFSFSVNEGGVGGDGGGGDGGSGGSGRGLASSIGFPSGGGGENSSSSNTSNNSNNSANSANSATSPTSSTPSTTNTTPNTTIITATCNQEGEVFLWVAKIAQQIQLNNHLFHSPLDTILSREKQLGLPIPAVIHHCLSQFEQRGIFFPDLFLRTGNPHALNHLKKQVGRGKIPDLSTYDPYVLANLIEAFLLSLPEPLLTFPLCDVLVHEKNISNHNTLDDVLLLPDPNRHLIEVLSLFLLRLSSHTSFNNLTLESLSSRFAPAFFRTHFDLPKHEQTNLAHKVTLHLLQLYEKAAGVLGLVVQTNENGYSYLNSLGEKETRCLPTTTIFTGLSSMLLGGAEGGEGTQSPMLRGKLRTITLDTNRKSRRLYHRASVKRLQELNQQEKGGEGGKEGSEETK